MLLFYTLIINYQKEKENNPIANNCKKKKKNKIARNKLNQGGERPKT